MPVLTASKKIIEATKAEPEVTPKEDSRKIQLPQIPSPRPTWEQAEEYFASLTPEQSSAIEAYVYRLHPKIMRQLADPKNPNHIELIEGRPYRDYIKQAHGGGQYWLKINDRSTQRKHTLHMMDVKLDIPITEAMPKLNLAELDFFHRDNRAYSNMMVAEGKMTQDGKVIGAPGAPMSGDATSQIVGQVIAAFQKMSADQQAMFLRAGQNNDSNGLTSAMGAILIEQMKQNNPSNHITGVKELVGAVKEMIPPPPKTDNDIFTAFMKMQADSDKAKTDLLMKFIEFQTKQSESKREHDDEGDEPGKKGFLGNVKELLEVVSLIKGGGRVAEKTTLEVVMDGVSAVGPQLLQTVQAAFNYATVAKTGMAPMAPMGMNGFPSQPEVPTGLPPAPAPQPAPAPAAQQGMNPIQQMLAQFGPIIANHLVDRGQDFGELFTNMYGQELFNMIAQIPTEVLVQNAQQVPAFWERVKISGRDGTFGEAYFKKWFDDFKAWESLLSAEEEEDDK